jgi:hypothetical protein
LPARSLVGHGRQLRPSALSSSFCSASTGREIDAAFASVAQNRTEALVVGPDIFFLMRRVQFATLAAHYNCPAIYFDRTFVEFGGLIKARIGHQPANGEDDRH